MDGNISIYNVSNTPCQSIFHDLDGVDAIHLASIAILNALLIPVTLISNLTLMMALIKTKTRRFSSGRQIFAVTDLLVGLFLQPMAIGALVSSTVRKSCTAKWIIQFLSYCLLYMDACLIKAVALERLLILWYPRMKEFTRRLQTISGNLSKLTRRPRGGGHIQISLQLMSRAE